MSQETYAFFALLSASLLPFVWAAHKRKRGTAAFGALALGAAIGFGLLAADGLREPATVEQEVEGRPIAVRGNDYVSSQACQACHPDQHASWNASFHRTMTQVASPESVVGDFGGEVVRAYGEEVRPFERDGAFFLEMPALSPLREGEVPPSEGRIERQVVMTTGLHHMQAYWYESGEDRRVALAPIVWLQDAQRWVPEPSTFLRPPTRKFKDDQGRWNELCQQCHATGAQPRLSSDGEAGTTETTVGEFGIACEACHGPGREHVEANRNPIRRYLAHFRKSEQHDEDERDAEDPTIVNPLRLSPERSSQVCGQCHSIGMGLTEEHDRIARDSGFPYRPGQDLHETRWIIDGRDRDSELPQQLQAFDRFFYADRYWRDGEVRVSGREYQGLLMSPCFDHDGPAETKMSCLSCHDLHPSPEDARPRSEWADDQLRPEAETDQPCLECHPAIAASIPEHTNHAVDSSGSSCTNCHMPYTTYGLLKAIRSHTISSPDVATSIETGRPNACNACHLDRSMGWAADRLEAWYGIDRPELSSEQEKIAASLLWLGTGDAGQRALASWYMSWSPAQAISRTDWMTPFLASLLDDPYDAVRFISHRSLESLPGSPEVDFDFMAPRSNRITVARDVMKRWAEQRDLARITVDDALLIDSMGGLRSNQWHALVARRNDQRVRLEE